MDKLPKEILLQILQYLPYADLKRSLLVCQRILDAGLEPCLWRGFCLIVSSRNIGNLSEILELDRFENLKSVKFLGCNIKNKQLKLIKASNVKHIQIGAGHDLEKDCEISDVSPGVLASFIGKMEVFKYHNSLLTEMNLKQINSVAKELENTHNLKHLEIFYNNSLTSLPAETLASAMSTLTELSLVFQKLNPDKYNALFSQINHSSNLKVLNLQGNNLSKVNPGIFGSAVIKLEKVNLSDCKINKDMLIRLFSDMQKDSKLKDLDVSYNPALKHIDDHIYGDAINLLNRVNLKFTNSTLFQLMNLFELMEVHTNLHEMNLVGNISLSKIPQPLFARTVTKLTKITIYATKLTSDQIQTLLYLIVNQPVNLSDLDLGGNNLSSIPSPLLAESVNKLETVILYYAHLSISQQENILEEAVKETKLKHLDLGGNQLGVSKDLIWKAKKKIFVLKFSP